MTMYNMKVQNLRDIYMYNTGFNWN